jgi:hypothetical protein
VTTAREELVQARSRVTVAVLTMVLAEQQLGGPDQDGRFRQRMAACREVDNAVVAMAQTMQQAAEERRGGLG